MEFLPISFETILNILNKNKNKLNFDDIFFQIKNNPNYKIEAIELYLYCILFLKTDILTNITLKIQCLIHISLNLTIFSI